MLHQFAVLLLKKLLLLSYPSVAIVILNYNGRNFLEKFLPAVIASTYPNKRVIVADNASTDDSTSFLEKEFPSIDFSVVDIAEDNVEKFENNFTF